MTNFDESFAKARALMHERKAGILSTISEELPGYPFGSVVPFCLDRGGQPLILISAIAEHTRNVRADSRVSLTIVSGNEGDVQEQARLTLVADARLLDSADEDESTRYYRYFPKSQDYHKVHDFSFYRLNLVKVRFIGGFGQIYWLDKDEFLCPNPFSEADEVKILSHMNEDHQEAMRHYFRVYKEKQIPAEFLEMVGIDAEGFDILWNERVYRFAFSQPVASMAEARSALVSMARL